VRQTPHSIKANLLALSSGSERSASFGIGDRSIDVGNCSFTPPTFVVFGHLQFCAQMLKRSVHVRLAGERRIQSKREHRQQNNNRGVEFFSSHRSNDCEL